MVSKLKARGDDIHCCDIKDGCDARELFRCDTSIYDLVVHCAYHVGGRAQINNNRSLLAMNLELDAMMFDWVARTGQRRVLYFSSSAAYPIVHQQYGSSIRLNEGLIDLNRTLQPDADYGWSKLTGERLAHNLNRAGVPVHVVRPFSGYGEDQDPDEYPFPAIVRRVCRGDLVVWGPPGQCRDWIHIDDVVAGALEIVGRNEREPVNLCTGIATEFGDLALAIAEQSQTFSVLRNVRPTYDVNQPTGVMYRVGNPTRMLRFREPSISLRQGIDRALKARG
jgi:nucleoside-diphosphate-sugar epimerase